MDEDEEGLPPDMLEVFAATREQPGENDLPGEVLVPIDFNAIGGNDDAADMAKRREVVERETAVLTLAHAELDLSEAKRAYSKRASEAFWAGFLGFGG